MLKYVYEYANYKLYLVNNFFEGINRIEMPKSLKEDKDVVALTITEQNKLEDYLETHTSNYKNIILLCLYTGMRIGEVGGLKWEDIDWNKKCINIQRSLSCQYENGVKTMRLTKPKTHNSYRSIPFMAETEEIHLHQDDRQYRWLYSVKAGFPDSLRRGHRPCVHKRH